MSSRLASRASKSAGNKAAPKKLTTTTSTHPRTQSAQPAPQTPETWLATRTAAALSSARLNSTVGIVVSAGLMQQAVKVQTTKQRFDTHLRRHYNEQSTHIVSDPADSTRAGDVVRIAPWPRKGKGGRVSHVVTEIVKAFGDGRGGEMKIEERPAVMSVEELVRRGHERWMQKQGRRRERREKEEAEEEEERMKAEAERESDMAATRLQKKEVKMAQEGVEMEAQAEEIERSAQTEGGETVDLEKRKEEMRSSSS